MPGPSRGRDGNVDSERGRGEGRGWGRAGVAQGDGKKGAGEEGLWVGAWERKVMEKKKPRHVSVYPGWWMTMFNMNSKGKL